MQVQAMPSADAARRLALRCSGLTRRFGAHVAVDHLDLAVPEGEIFGLLGRNGAGKSTLIKMLTTLLPPTSGEAQVEGFDLRTQAAQIRQVIGYVPQALSADGELTGYENLLVFAQLYDLPRATRRQQIADALAFMGLGDAAHRLVSTYSGGMIRRLEIAQSMLHRPRLLFLDEPTAGLDPVARESVWERIRELQARFGTTIVMTTHYMDEAEALCAQVAILRDGRLVAAGTLEALRAECGAPGATLDELFAHFTGEAAEAANAYRGTSDARRAGARLG